MMLPRVVSASISESARHITAAKSSTEEELVVDQRCEIRPAQAVEQKLSDLLKGKGMMVSQMRSLTLIAQRH